MSCHRPASTTMIRLRHTRLNSRMAPDLRSPMTWQPTRWSSTKGSTDSTGRFARPSHLSRCCQPCQSISRLAARLGLLLRLCILRSRLCTAYDGQAPKYNATCGCFCAMIRHSTAWTRCRRMDLNRLCTAGLDDGPKALATPFKRVLSRISVGKASHRRWHRHRRGC